MASNIDTMKLLNKIEEEK